MAWLIDNAGTWCVLIAIVGLAFATAWWFRRNTEYLYGAAIALGLIAVLLPLSRLIVTDRKRIELNIREMAAAVLEGKSEVLLKHLATDFDFQNAKRDAVAEAVVRRAKDYKIDDVSISQFDVEEMTAISAKVYFKAKVHNGIEGRYYPFACRGTFVRENDQWKLKEIRFYNPFVNQNQPIALPIP